MLFVGDIASPSDLYPKDDALARLTGGGPVVANLEGALHDCGPLSGEGKELFNHPSVIEYMERNGIKVVTLANNHIFDVTDNIGDTIATLQSHGIHACGAGETLSGASEPAVLVTENRTWVFIAFGWETIQCVPAGHANAGVNPLTTDHLLSSVRTTRAQYPDATLVVLPHWNYELEAYPMPLHRELAFRAIDAGADAVVGCHSHCVQGIELYSGKPIVYGLGNWFLVQGEFFGGRLTFPDFASLQLAFEWKPDVGEMGCHWFEYAREGHTLTFVESEPLSESARVRDLTPFAGMSHEAYVQWFRRHRRKNKLLPVYSDPDADITNRVRDAWVAMRQHLITAAFAMRLKGGPK